MCEQTGRLYTWQEAMNACPNGWRLPTDDEWWAMAGQFGKAHSFSKNGSRGAGEEAFKKLTKGGGSGFGASLGGQYNGSAYSEMGEAGYYWTSIQDKGSGKVLTYYFSSRKGFVSRVTENKSNYFSCRCVKE